MKRKKNALVIVAVLIVVVMCAAAAGVILIPRLKAGKMMENMIAEWRGGRIGSVGEDFRDVPGEVLDQFMPEIRDPELEELFELYEYRDSESGEWFKIFNSNEGSDEDEESIVDLSEEEYWEIMQTQYASVYEAELAEENENSDAADGGEHSDDGRQRVFDAIQNGIEVSYELPWIIRYPMELELTVSAPSIEDAYLSAGRECADNAEMWKAMADYIESGKAEMLEETRTVKLHKSGEKVYPESEPNIANVLTGGYAEYTARILAEAEE